MKDNNFLKMIKEGRIVILLSLLIGSLGYGIKLATKTPVADPLLLAMVIGIVVRTATGDRWNLKLGSDLSLRIFIPVGIVFYALKNLNFVKFVKVETNMIILLVVVMLVYFAVVLLLGKLMGQRKEITYLTATGSAICGASAIVITSPAVEAEPDDISISLLSVALAVFLSSILLRCFFPGPLRFQSGN